MSIDSTLSDQHYTERLKQGSMADMILVDHDKLERFKVSGKPVRRLTYCVNDHLFKPLEKTVDVSFHCGSGAHKGYPGGNERNELRAKLGEICKELELSYASGVLGLPEYAAALGHSKVVVNLPRTPINRPHRVFDAMAAGAYLINHGALPYIEEDKIPLYDTLLISPFETADELKSIIEWLPFDTNSYWDVRSNLAKSFIYTNHTWSIRSQQLRQILSEELGL